MGDKRGAEREERCQPMSRVKMIRSRDLNQFIAAREFVRQEMKKIKTANDKADKQPRDRTAQKKQQNPKQPACPEFAPANRIAQYDERDGNRDKRDQSD